MKAYTTLGDGIDALEMTDLPVPEPKDDEVLVKMTAAALNYRDLLVVRGIDAWKPAVRRVPVSDGAGRVTAVGRNVRRWKVGDRVAGIFLPKWLDGELTAEKYVSPLGGAASDGILAEYAVFHENALVSVPQSLTDPEAAALPVAGVTAWHAVGRRSAVQRGDTVLIQGTGGVSLFALQFAGALGARPLVTSSSDEKLERVKALGAWAGINYKTTPDWDAAALEMTAGRGVDHVVEVVGGENLNRSLNAVRLSGSIAFIGLIKGLGAMIDTYRFVTKNVRIHGIETGSREIFEEMNRFIEANGIRPVIDRIFEFGDARRALKYLESGSHFGKVVINIA